MYYRKLSSVLCRCRPGQVRTHATIGYVLVLTIIAPSLCESQCELDDTQRSSTKCSGSIQSPRHPDPYPAGQNCSWVIQGNDCKTVQLFINYLDIPSLPGGSCTDYIRIQGSGNYSRQICGSLKDLESSRLNVTQPVIVSFHSKRSLGATGFSITYQGLSERVRRDDQKDVWSTNRTYTLPKSPTYTGVVRIGIQNHYIVLQPNVGPAPKCGTSPFTIEDEDGHREELCEVYGRIYESFIDLHINNSVNKNGWSDKLNVYLVPVCRGTIKVQQTPVTVLLTPFFPLSPSMPYECSWLLEKTAFVSIKIIGADDSEPLPTCSESPIRVVTENGEDTLCNLKHYVVHEGEVWLVYRTPDTVKTPWRGTLQMQSLASYSTNCGLSTEEDYVISEHWTNILESLKYSNNIDCTWILQVPTGTNILLTFHLFGLRDPIGHLDGLALCEDFIKIRDHASLLFYKCGSEDMMYSVLSSGPIMYVQFVSDVSDSALGFRAVYKALCRRVYSEHYDIMSPNYPNVLSPADFKCKWLFSKVGYTIMVKLVTDPDGSEHPECKGSPIQVQMTNYNYRPEELCSTHTEVITKSFAAITYTYVLGTTEPWIGKIAVRVVKTLNDSICTWLCPYSDCKPKDYGPHVDINRCTCSKPQADTPCSDFSEACSPEECSSALCEQSAGLISEDFSFETPKEKPLKDLWCTWTIQKPKHHVIIQFDKSVEAQHPACGLSVVKVEFEDERLTQELCSSTPSFMYSSDKKLIFHYRYLTSLIFGNFLGQIGIRFVARLNNLDCVSACHQDSCKLYYYNNSISLAPRCVCSKNIFLRPCLKEAEMCLSEQCVFGNCWKNIHSSAVFIPPDVSPVPKEYTKCVWTIYKENHLVLLKHLDAVGNSSLGPTCNSSTVKIKQNNTEIARLCRDNPVYVAVGQTDLVYTHSSSLSVRVAVMLVPFPSDDSCDWLCSQRDCEVKIVDQTNQFTCHCPQRFLNLSCEEHKKVCLAEECINKPASEEGQGVLTSGPSETRDINASRVKNATQQKDVYCKDDKSTLNKLPLHWTKTEASQKDVEDCPVANNIATRDCIVNDSMPGVGQWTRPNVTNCVQTAINDMHDATLTANSIGNIMKNLSDLISAMNETSNEMSMSSSTVMEICDILKKASSVNDSSTTQMEKATEVMNNFVRTVNFITDSKSLNSLNTNDMDSLDAVMGVVFETTSAFFKHMVTNLKNVSVMDSHKPNVWCMEKNIDIRVKLWSNQKTLSDTNDYARINLDPAEYKDEKDKGKPLWLYIARFNNVNQLMKMREKQLNTQKLTWRSENETANTNTSQAKDIASVVVSVEFFNKSNFILSSPLSLVFSLKGTKAPGTTFQCVFLQITAKMIRSYWSGYGCVKTSENETHVVCHCHHVTNFAVLVDIFESQRALATLHMTTLSVISYVGSALSILSCILLLILYFVLNLRGDRIRIHQQFAASIIFVQTLFLVMVKVSENYGQVSFAVCMSIAIALHYSVTSMFFWMLVEGVHMYVLLVVVFSTKTYFYKYLAVAWGGPLVIVGIALAVYRETYMSGELCWIHTNVLRLFLIPTLAIVVVINVLILSQVILIINRTESVFGKMNRNEQQLLRTGLKASVVLLPLLGLTWVFAFFIVSVETSPVLSHLFTYLFTITNSFQGLLLFIFHCVLSSEVRQNLGFYIRKKRLQSESSGWSRRDTTSHVEKDTMAEITVHPVFSADEVEPPVAIPKVEDASSAKCQTLTSRSTS